jgi:hypothetical protein
VCKPEGHQGQVPMAPWVSLALRWAYPWGHYDGYATNMPEEIEEDMPHESAARMLTEDNLLTWCGLLNTAELPPMTAEHAD